MNRGSGAIWPVDPSDCPDDEDRARIAEIEKALAEEAAAMPADPDKASS